MILESEVLAKERRGLTGDGKAPGEERKSDR